MPLSDTGQFGFYFFPETIDLCLYLTENNVPSSVVYCFCFHGSISGKVSGTCAYSQVAVMFCFSLGGLHFLVIYFVELPCNLTSLIS